MTYMVELLTRYQTWLSWHGCHVFRWWGKSVKTEHVHKNDAFLFTHLMSKIVDWLSDRLFLTGFQPIWGYFISRF